MDYSSFGLSVITISATFTFLKLIQVGLNRLADNYHLNHK